MKSILDIYVRVRLKTKDSLHIYVHYTHKYTLHMCVFYIYISYVYEVKELISINTQILITCICVYKSPPILTSHYTYTEHGP